MRETDPNGDLAGDDDVFFDSFELAKYMDNHGRWDAIPALLKALKPFADFATKKAPRDQVITQGSHMAKRQLSMGDCQQAAAAIAKATDNGRGK